jgi:hypothetical protein
MAKQLLPQRPGLFRVSLNRYGSPRGTAIVAPHQLSSLVREVIADCINLMEKERGIYAQELRELLVEEGPRSLNISKALAPSA